MSGLLNDFLEEIDRPGEVIRNLLAGRPRSAGRKALDFIDAPVRRLLPFGDKIAPEVSTPDDSESGGDLIGLHEPGVGKTVADIGLGILTDPLSIVSFGAGQGLKLAGKTVAAAGKTVDPLTLLQKGASTAINKSAELADRAVNAGRMGTTVQVTPAQDTVKKVGQTIRNTLGWHDLNDAQRQTLADARGIGQTYAKAATAEAERAFKGLTPDEQVAVGDAIDALHWDKGKAIGLLPGQSVSDRISALAAANPSLRANEMQRAATTTLKLSETMFNEDVKAGAFKPMGNGKGTNDYLQRQFHRPMADFETGDRVAGSSSALKSRTLETPEALLDYIQQNPKIGYERNALRRTLDRAGQRGRMIERAEIGKRVTGNPGFNLIDDAQVARDTIKTIGNSGAPGATDFAYRLDQAFNGMAPRGWFTSALASANRIFKPAVTAGLVLPKVGFLTKNQLGMVWQAYSTPGVPLATQRHAVRNYLDSFDDAFEKVTNSRLGDTLGAGRSRLTDSIKQIEQALRQSGGSAEAATQYLHNIKRPDLVEAMHHGVLDGFVSTEEILKRLTNDRSWTSKAVSILDAPGAIMQGQEQRARLGTFLDLRDRFGSGKAAQLTKEAYLDYDVTGQANRTLRDIVPFAQFIAQSIPQQAKLLSRSPATAVGVASLFSQDQGLPKYDWMQGQASVPIGLDQKGDPEYLTSVGLPVEALQSIPDGSGRSFEQLLGQTHPLIKTAYAAITGHDPQFETPFMSYDKEPITGNHSELGRAYNLAAGTGLIAPIDAPLRQVSTLLDSRKGGAEKALQLLGGMRVASVDPDIAERKNIVDLLSRNPQVHSATSYFQTGDDPAVDAEIEKLKDAKKRLKIKRAQEALGTDNPIF